MNTNALVRKYDTLTPEERWKLIFAAGDRGDEAEQSRLADSAQRITLCMTNYAPFALAFREVALHTFAELLADAAGCLEKFQALKSGPDNAEDDAIEDDPDEAKHAGDDADEDYWRMKPVWQREFDLALATGNMFKTKAAGWKLFCERLNLPPFALFKIMPGFGRIERALKLTEVAAFTREGMVRWLNAIRPPDAPKVALVELVSVEEHARVCDDCFRERVKWWGG
jgi:hypothetical protein